MRTIRLVPLSLLLAAAALAACAGDASDVAPESTAAATPAPAAVPIAPADTADTTAADSTGPRVRFRAVGQEPGWLLTIDDTLLVLRWDYDEKRASLRAPVAQAIPGGRRWTVLDSVQPITITARDTACADAMSGRAYPSRVQVRVARRVLDGCGGDPTRMLFGDEWKVDSLNGAPLAAGSTVSIGFGDDGRAFGMASCNNFTATFDLRGDSVTFQPAIVTRRACIQEERNAQETAFLKALDGTALVRVDPAGRLTITGPGGRISATR